MVCRIMLTDTDVTRMPEPITTISGMASQAEGIWANSASAMPAARLAMMIRRIRPRVLARDARYSVPEMAPSPPAPTRKPISSAPPPNISRTITGISVA